MRRGERERDFRVTYFLSLMSSDFKSQRRTQLEGERWRDGEIEDYKNERQSDREKGRSLDRGLGR